MKGGGGMRKHEGGKPDSRRDAEGDGDYRYGSTDVRLGGREGGIRIGSTSAAGHDLFPAPLREECLVHQILGPAGQAGREEWLAWGRIGAKGRGLSRQRTPEWALDAGTLRRMNGRRQQHNNAAAPTAYVRGPGTWMEATLALSRDPSRGGGAPVSSTRCRVKIPAPLGLR